MIVIVIQYEEVVWANTKGGNTFHALTLAKMTFTFIPQTINAIVNYNMLICIVLVCIL